MNDYKQRYERRNNAVISDKRLVVWFLKNGIKPKDIFIHDRTDAMMFAFDKDETKELYDIYMSDNKSK